jgi:hypothetical protein
MTDNFYPHVRHPYPPAFPVSVSLMLFMQPVDAEKAIAEKRILYLRIFYKIPIFGAETGHPDKKFTVTVMT